MNVRRNVESDLADFTDNRRSLDDRVLAALGRGAMSGFSGNLYCKPGRAAVSDQRPIQRRLGDDNRARLT